MPSSAVTVEDSTLREGEQTPGVVFSERDKRVIAEALAEAGVQYLEAGIAVAGSGEFRTLKALAADPALPTLIGWNRGMRTDLDASFDAGLTAVHIGLPSSDIHIVEKFGRSREWVIETAIELVEYARSCGATFVSVSAEDMGRADIDFLARYARALSSAGATRLRLSDTVGTLTPGRVAAIVATLRSEAPIDLQLHMHNDAGLALANVVAGVEAGARQVHATVNGLGDRAGIAALHQVVATLEILYGYGTGIELAALPRLSALVAAITSLQPSHNEPIVGDSVFTHESGIHVDGLMKSQRSFDALDASLFGREHRVVLGKLSGSSAVVQVLEQAGIAVTRDQARELLPLIRDLAQATRQPVAPAVARLLAERLLDLDGTTQTEARSPTGAY